MPAATALVSGNDPTPQLAEQAVAQARARLGGAHANAVLLLLSPEFARHAQATVRAVARAAQCTQIFGGVAAGVCNETGWVLDRPAAAAMVFAGGLTLAAGDVAADAPLLCCTSTPFPSEWSHSRRFGLHFHGTSGNGAVWQGGRRNPLGSVEAKLIGARAGLIVSQGLQAVGEAAVVAGVRGYDLLSLRPRDDTAAKPEAALDHLLGTLPQEWQQRPLLPLHLANALIGDGSDDGAGHAGRRTAALLSANADRSLTLTKPLQVGDTLRWARREPAHAAAEMHALLATGSGRNPDFAICFSCIGRGPYFYGGDDRDLAALTGRYPGMPLIGAYGTGQIACFGEHSRQLQNAVVAALFEEESNVQPES